MTTDAPDEPRATLREDEREDLLIASHTVEPIHLTGEALFAVVERIIAAHVAERLAPLLAAARAEEGERIAVAIEAAVAPIAQACGDPGSVTPREVGIESLSRWSGRAARTVAARIARSAARVAGAS